METLFFFFSFFFDRKKTRWFFYVRNIIEFPPDFSTWKFPWIDRNTNRVRLTPFAVHPLLHERCNARGVDFTIFSDRFHYTGTTSVPIRPRWLKNSSLRLSVPSPPSLVLGDDLEDIFMFAARNRRPRVTGITVVLWFWTIFAVWKKKKRKKDLERVAFLRDPRKNFSGRRVKRGACYRQMYVQGVYDATLSLETFPPFLKLQREVFWESRKTIWRVTTRGEKYFSRFAVIVLNAVMTGLCFVSHFQAVSLNLQKNIGEIFSCRRKYTRVSYNLLFFYFYLSSRVWV